SEMELATGCTEPAAIALTAAYAGEKLREAGDTIERVTVLASVNMIKNAMAAGIPGTNYTGIEYAAVIGALGGASAEQLQVISHADKAAYPVGEALVKAGKVTVDVAPVPQKLYIDVVVSGKTHVAHAIIANLHTNLVLLELDGNILVEKDAAEGSGGSGISPDEISAYLSVAKIYHFIDKELDPMKDPIDIIRQSIAVNTAISEAGLAEEYGLHIGRTLEKNCKEGTRMRDMVTNAMIVTTAGADARMAGAPYSVVANSGSGNQGITATMPVVATAKWLDIGEEKMLRAVTLSNLMTIYIKSRFGRLSALCGATVASTGAACGITYLLGGDAEAVSRAVHNMMGNVTGMLCDGAKADCALKISTCVNAAVQAALMAIDGVRVQNTDGIVETDVERTIVNFATLGNEGSSAM
ncbi:MAG: L-serine ammonia-lyase, iron-sulfur-dependent, subunit alpha, partial [Pygmaiobacter sp.]